MRFPIKLDSSNTILCSELTLLEYKEILKVIYGDEPCKETFIETITALLAQVSNRDQEFYKQLNIIELLLILIKLRVQSMGDSTTVNLKKQENQTSLELRLDWMAEDLEMFNSQFVAKRIEQKAFDIILAPPSITKLQESVEDEYLYFIKAVYIKESKTLVPVLDNASAKAFFEKLPAKVAASVIGYFEAFVKELKNVNFLSRYGIVEQALLFIPSIDSLLWFAKLMYTESLESFYENIFYLSYYGHMDGKFLNSCTPGEYIYFAKKLQEILAQQKSTHPIDNQNVHGDENLPEELQDDEENS